MVVYQGGVQRQSPVVGFPAGSGFYTTGETMAALGVCTRVTFTKYRRLGLVTPVAIVGTQHVYSVKEVRRARVALDAIRKRRQGARVR
jgi:hypothetical protein